MALSTTITPYEADDILGTLAKAANDQVNDTVWG